MGGVGCCNGCIIFWERECKMQTKFLFIDAETDGLYGSFLTVELVVTDDAGNMIEKAYYGVIRNREKLCIK